MESIGPQHRTYETHESYRSHAIAEDRATYLAALSDVGLTVPLETVRGYTMEQATQAENYCRRLKLRLTTPIDVPERPAFLSLL